MMRLINNKEIKKLTGRTSLLPLAFAACLLFAACNTTSGQKEEERSNEPDTQKSVITKEALLDCIDRTIALLATQNYTEASFTKFFDSLGKKYKVEIYQPESGSYKKDNLVISLRFSKAVDTFDLVHFLLPEAATADLTYKDLAGRFGPWKKDQSILPPPKDFPPVTFRFIDKPYSKSVYIQVDSRAEPETIPNKIWSIEIIQMNKSVKNKNQ